MRLWPSGAEAHDPRSEHAARLEVPFPVRAPRTDLHIFFPIVSPKVLISFDLWLSGIRDAAQNIDSQELACKILRSKELASDLRISGNEI
jgi:hypothetical protein